MHDIIFSKSDKGGAIVISKKTHYIKEGLRQLNSIHYTEIQEPNLLLIKNNIQTQISRMFDNGEIDGITLDFLRGSSKEGPKLGRLFLLPKLHKLSEHVIQRIEKQTMAIPNCELKKLPVVYQEFFQALNCIREKIEFPLSVENIYDQHLFVNPNIVLNNRTIVWHDFIGAGIVCLKDICFEVKTGFLPDHAIVEMIQVVYEDVNVQYVVDRYRNLLNVIPVEWKNTVNTDIHRISIPRTIDISIICKNVHYDLKLCSTKTLYTIMLENIVEEPVGIELWKSEFDVSSEAFSKIWEHVNMYWKPSNLVELDFKVLHNCIFTNVKLQKIGLVDDNICKVCCREKEDILHIFMNCDKLEDFHNYLSSLLVRIFENCDSDKISLVRSEELLILGLRWHMKGVNDTFLNFFMSVARYCIFRRRNLLNSGYSNVNLIKLFQYTLKHYVTYIMPGSGPKYYPCVLCNKRTKPHERRSINKSVAKYLNKNFLITPKQEDKICNTCKHKYYVQETKHSSVVQHRLSDDEDYVPPAKRRSTVLSSPPSVSLSIPSTSKSHSYCFICKKPGPKLIVVPSQARFSTFL
ncbi:unnamed protein product [Mytilus coruscus]|uniref:Uncharacterized protein n=1 Tax=Mytilus coruscus TaxID=42192 RepID=A0A6J8EHB0_MYTCO|nr:unnamed protein product [Mytilus coruscus]